MSEQLSRADHKEATTVERRDAPRYPFICPVELTDLRRDARISARTSDLSLHGCYIDTLNPFPEGTRVRLRLTKSNRRLELQARVTCCHRGSGMGLVFEQATSEQTATLISWLESTPSREETAFPAAPPAIAPQDAPKALAQFAAKLLKVLERKGVLTRSEAAEIFRDLDS